MNGIELLREFRNERSETAFAELAKYVRRKTISIPISRTLVGRLTSDLYAGDPESEATWKQETLRRLAEIETGATELVDGEAVATRIRQIGSR
jgi:hypothetical protein